jgi:hypothetical protein
LATGSILISGEDGVGYTGNTKTVTINVTLA